MLEMDALRRKHFDEAVYSFLRNFTEYLLSIFPFDNQVIKYARFFQPSLQQSIAAPNAISHLTLSIAQVLGTDEEVFQAGKYRYKTRLLWFCEEGV